MTEYQHIIQDYFKPQKKWKYNQKYIEHIYTNNPSCNPIGFIQGEPI